MNPGALAVPPGVVTVTFPEDPSSIVAVIEVDEFTINDPAGVPPKLTAVAPVKFVPVIVITAPGPPAVGLNVLIVGVGKKMNPAKLSTPPGVFTRTLPVEPEPTIAEILVELSTINEAAGVPPKLTAVAPVKFVPVIVIVAPLPAEVGLNEVTV